ncbi:hypothetical protein GCM10023238_39110 [Streptomyces heliomycini]
MDPAITWARRASSVDDLLSVLAARWASLVLGSVMSSRITGYDARTPSAAQTAGAGRAAAKTSGSGTIPDMDLLPPSIRTWLESAYGHGIADIFLYVAPIALLAFLVTLFIKEVPLRTSGAWPRPRRPRPRPPAGGAPRRSRRVADERFRRYDGGRGAGALRRLGHPGRQGAATQRLAAVATATAR